MSTAHDASYVTCTTCHADYGGQDGRTWDFSQLGASLRNTMDLRGRSQAAPGTCAAILSTDAAMVGQACHFDAECGAASAPGACVADASMIPPHKSGEFFGFFSVFEKFAGILGPLFFAWAIAITGSSRVAILSVIAFFAVGAVILALVDVDAGRKAAREVEAAVPGA